MSAYFLYTGDKRWDKRLRIIQLRSLVILSTYFLYTGDKRWDKDFELSICAVMSFCQRIFLTISIGGPNGSKLANKAGILGPHSKRHSNILFAFGPKVLTKV